MDEKQREFGDRLEALQRRHRHFTWECSFADLAMILAQVQLALRHPGNVGYASKRAHEIIESWIKTLEASEPGIGEIFRMGFNPEHDVEVNVR